MGLTASTSSCLTFFPHLPLAVSAILRESVRTWLSSSRRCWVRTRSTWPRPPGSAPPGCVRERAAASGRTQTAQPSSTCRPLLRRPPRPQTRWGHPFIHPVEKIETIWPRWLWKFRRLSVCLAIIIGRASEWASEWDGGGELFIDASVIKPGPACGVAKAALPHCAKIWKDGASHVTLKAQRRRGKSV